MLSEKDLLKSMSSNSSNYPLVLLVLLLLWLVLWDISFSGIIDMLGLLVLFFFSKLLSLLCGFYWRKYIYYSSYLFLFSFLFWGLFYDFSWLRSVLTAYGWLWTLPATGYGWDLCLCYLLFCSLLGYSASKSSAWWWLWWSSVSNNSLFSSIYTSRRSTYSGSCVPQNGAESNFNPFLLFLRIFSPPLPSLEIPFSWFSNPFTRSRIV